ncbi:ADP-ribosyl cyclase/cyclic ADP-ribose hydrolase-like [Porites lutea]|uniref:ADP-ribosyl cyclase/cyclic ADP-ribose hydrolase-like n=1 Tax=Porites lutea TaxID=51062 RepID=UPI003CC58F14
MSFLFVAGSLFLFTTIELSVAGEGSTPKIKEIVLGRCYEYQLNTIGPEADNWKDCNEIWEAFHQAFAYKNPCTLAFDDYQPFFDATGMQELTKSLFWSGTYKVAHVYSDSGDRYTTLEDTLAGYPVNGLTWCGNENLFPSDSDGIDYNSCPDWSECDYTTPFWGLASTTFARHARGIARVMLNGSRVDSNGKPVPYREDSFFAKYELPNLQVNKVSELRIVVVHKNGPKRLRKGCYTASIRMLKKHARNRGLKVTCYDDPNDVRHILCTDDPFSRKCLFLLFNSWRH